MNLKLKALTAGVLFFTGQALFAQEVAIDSTSTNKDVKEIKEVEIVAVAYGKQKKEAITGSVGQIKADALKNVSAPNAVQGAIGKVAGVQVSSSNGLPGTDPIVRFRGIGSINGSSAPLYVVDGVPFNGSISAINSADIESMSFLKDASAAALYGSRGANGVIIITTKKGRKGKTRYNLDLKAGVSMRGVPEYNIITSPKEYYEAYHRVLKNSALDSQKTKDINAAHTSASNTLASTKDTGLAYNITNVDGNLIIGQDGRFNPNANILYSEDWESLLFRNGFFTNTYFSGSGGGENSTHFFSLGYESNDTYMVNSKFERVTSRLKLDTKLGSRIKLGGNLAYTHMIQNAPDGYTGSGSVSNPFSWTRNIAPIYPVHVYDKNGNAVFLPNGDKAYDDGTGTYNGGISRPYGNLQNPYATALLDIKKNTTNQIYGSAYATYNILSGLDFTYTLTGEFRNFKGISLDTALYGDANGVNGRLTDSSSNIFSITNQQLLTYDKKFGNFGIQAMIGHETLERKYEYLSASVEKGLLTNSPYINQYGVLGSASGYAVPYSTEGYFGRLNLEYKNKYFINANIRRDGSSRFHPDNRWGTFFGIGGAWAISKEAFLSNISWLNNFRVKVSYGEQGNDNLNNGAFSHYASFFAQPYADLFEVTQTFNANEPVSLTQVFKGNKNITWEKNANFNVGFDLDLFNNRFNLEAEYFNRKSFDMLYMKPLPLSEGFASTPENVGDMINRGVEISTRIDLFKKSDFSFSINGNGTFLKNEILKLSEDEVVDGGFLLKPGNTRYNRRLREFVGVNPETGAAIFTKIDPTTGEKTTTESYTEATLIDTGKSAVPKFYGGFGANLKFKNFDFSVNFAYQLGGWGYDNAWMDSFDGNTGENFHKDYKSTWSYDNTGASLPVILSANSKNYYSASTLGLIKSDYLSLQNISLGYTLSKDIVKVAGIDTIRIYTTADNIYVWSKRKGYDPRQSLTGSSSNNFSPIRTIAFGLNVSF